MWHWNEIKRASIELLPSIGYEYPNLVRYCQSGCFASYLHKYITKRHHQNGAQKLLKSTHISLKSRDIASTSIIPVIFSWFAKCRRSVISLRALLANWTFSNTRVTNLIATVSPEISSAAELLITSLKRRHHDMVYLLTLRHHMHQNPFLELASIVSRRETSSRKTTPGHDILWENEVCILEDAEIIINKIAPSS